MSRATERNLPQRLRYAAIAADLSLSQSEHTTNINLNDLQERSRLSTQGIDPGRNKIPNEICEMLEV